MAAGLETCSALLIITPTRTPSPSCTCTGGNCSTQIRLGAASPALLSIFPLTHLLSRAHRWAWLDPGTMALEVPPWTRSLRITTPSSPFFYVHK